MKAPESSLPIISIAPYLPSDLIAPPGETSTPSREPVTREQVARAVHLACRDVGFFYLDVGSFIRLDEMREVLDLGRDFFSLPGEDKEEIGLAKSDGIRGYQKLNQNVTQGKADHHEGIDFYASNPYKSLANSSTRPEDRPGLRPLEGENQWPTQMPHMKPRMEQWVDKMKILGLAAMEAMADGLGCTPAEKEDWRGMIDDSFWVMRMIGYPPLPDGADGISCGEHKDYGCLTFLLADPIPGSLQVLSTDGQWLNADMIPNCLVVNIGEMIQRWTGGLYPATLHRVIHRSPKYRVSVPFFFEPNFSARVRTLPAAERRMAEEGFSPKPNEEVVYGDFLLGKVSGNFKY